MSGYPIILNGDHAEFEAEYANVPPKERPDWPLPSFDARDWAQAFCAAADSFGFKDSNGNRIDEGWMIGWFANALMRGFDEHASLLPPTTKLRWGFKGRNQLPLFMVWREVWDGGEVVHADVLFNTQDWIRV